MEKKSESERISYARKALLDLVEKRELRAWCMERDLPHSSIYKVAVGTDIPSYILVCQMLPYFSPAEWVYFTDEEIPYKHEPLPAFNPKEFSVFIKKHKIDMSAFEGRKFASFNDFFTAKYVDNIIHPIAIKDPSNALIKSKLLIKSPRVYIILYIPYIILGIVFDPIITPNTEPIVVASSA